MPSGTIDKLKTPASGNQTHSEQKQCGTISCNSCCGHESQLDDVVQLLRSQLLSQEPDRRRHDASSEANFPKIVQLFANPEAKELPDLIEVEPEHKERERDPRKAHAHNGSQVEAKRKQHDAQKQIGGV